MILLEFSKLTLATINSIVAIESVDAQKVTRTTTTTTTTMTKVVQDQPLEIEAGELACAQKPKVLLYESTKEDNQSDILTDDDTDSVGSSIDSKEIEAGLKEISQPTTQGTATNIHRIHTQMQNLSFLSPSEREHLTVKNDENLKNMSRQFTQLDLCNDDSGSDKTEENITQNEKSLLSNSIQTLSSNDTLDQEPNMSKKTGENNVSNEVIVLSDSDTEEAAPESEPRKRNISQEPPLKPTCPSSNDAAMYNLSNIDNSAMQKVNNFFDNAPFIEPADSSFCSSRMSKSNNQEDVFIPETSDEESINNSKSAINTSIVAAAVVEQPKESGFKEPQNEEMEQDRPDFSDNNIIVDIPVVKSTSDQPRQIIRQTSGVRLTASRSSPIVKTSTSSFDPDGVKRKSSNIILTTPGSSIRVNSSNGQLNIAAKININIQIVEDSSEESSEDNKPARKSHAIQSSEDCQHSTDDYQSGNSNHSDEIIPKTLSSKVSPKDSNIARTPTKNTKLDTVKTPDKTPSTASKIKQFQFVPPKSMTKNKKTVAEQENENVATKSSNQSIESEASENGDGFQVDKNIPISPRNQKLLVNINGEKSMKRYCLFKFLQYKVYGEAWKTPEVIRSYSAVKGKPINRAATNTTPTIFKNDRYSKGFDLCKLARDIFFTQIHQFIDIFTYLQLNKRLKPILIQLEWMIMPK